MLGWRGSGNCLESHEEDGEETDGRAEALPYIIGI